MNLLQIKPIDNTFFRDGKKFDFKSSGYIKSLNTPYISVFLGAMFTSLLTENDEFRSEFFKKIKKEKNNYKDILKLDNVFLYDECKKYMYIKAPLDLYINKSGDVKIAEIIDLSKNKNSIPFDYAFKSLDKINYKRASEYYISLYDLLEYYKIGYSNGIELLHQDEIFIKQRKIGIGLDINKNTVNEGQIYSIENTEFVNADWSYLIKYQINKLDYNEDIDDYRKGYLKLGGENKVARYSKVDEKKLKY